MTSSCPSRKASPNMVSSDLVTGAVVSECMHGCIHSMCVCVHAFLCVSVCMCVRVCVHAFLWVCVQT